MNIAPHTLNDFASYAGLVIAIIAVTPRLVSVFTRGKVGRFESILKAQDSLLDDCRSECEKLNNLVKSVKAELAQEVNQRTLEREHFYRQMTLINAHVYECEGILRRNGWKDPRKVKRGGGLVS